MIERRTDKNSRKSGRQAPESAASAGCGAPAGQKERRRAGRNFSGPWRKTPGRLIGAGLIRLYQLSLSGFVGGHCRHLPTCSEYGYEAIARHGLWAGGFMTLFRFIRCGPFGAHGFDPVPQALPPFYSPFAPWRYWRLPRESAAAGGGKRDKFGNKA